MKDYTLSEAKKICEKHRTCGDCPLKIVTQRGIGCMLGIMPRNWQNDIEPRDMVDLPYKQRKVDLCKKPFWRVFYRKNGEVFICDFIKTEAEADAFLAELKGGKA